MSGNHCRFLNFVANHIRHIGNRNHKLLYHFPITPSCSLAVSISELADLSNEVDQYSCFSC